MVVSLFSSNMVHVTANDLIKEIEARQRGRPMPYLCALSQAKGISEGFTEYVWQYNSIIEKTIISRLLDEQQRHYARILLS